MNPFKTQTLKLSIQRKPQHRVSIRHRQRILALIKNQANNGAQQILASASVVEHQTGACLLGTSTLSDVTSTRNCLQCNISDEASNNLTNNFSGDNSNNTGNINEISYSNTTDIEISNKMYDDSMDFQNRVAASFIQGNLTHTQGNVILEMLRSHRCLSYLPKDTRTLLNTPRSNYCITSHVSPGEYLHLGFEKAVVRILEQNVLICTPNVIDTDWSTDGGTLCRQQQIWPIQIRIANIPDCKPEVVGIYRGKKKPNNPEEFLKDFINEGNKIISNGGISFKDLKIPIVFRAFIADMVARAAILCHKGHCSKRPCSKCKVIGKRFHNTMVFLGINHTPRTDDEYTTLADAKRHLGFSPLLRLPMGIVSQVPFEYMHLVCLGVVKKFLCALVTG